MNKVTLSIAISSLIVVACNGGSSSSASPSAAPPVVNNIPSSYQCLPNVEASTSRVPALQLAYAEACSVATAPESVNLQQMAVALEYYVESSKASIEVPSGYYNYCSGVPLSYDPLTGVGFIVTAAHCVVGGEKLSNTQVTANNITTFNLTAISGDKGNKAWIHQGLQANPLNNPPASANLVAQITAIYIPSQYCQVPPFIESSGCANSGLGEQNGDIAVLKVNSINAQQLATSVQLQLAPSSLSMPSGDLLLSIGYGGVIGEPLNGNLNYINYQYFANDVYQGVTSQASLMNGYNYETNGLYYSIVCGGDSGGGDFYWNASTSKWMLVGVHSWGTAICGNPSSFYSGAIDVSGDTRPFEAWINTITKSDTAAEGCADLGMGYVCKAGTAL